MPESVSRVRPELIERATAWLQQYAEDLPGGQTNPDLDPEFYLVRALLEALSAPQWQHIETAPKDGELVVLYSSYGIRLGRWGVGAGWLSLNYGQPTHWTPILSPPSQKGA